jgi:hypothetical protein
VFVRAGVRPGGSSARAAGRRSSHSRSILQDLSCFRGYYSGRSTGKEGKEEGNEDRIKQLSEEDEEQEDGQSDRSAEEVEENETEEERDAPLHKEEIEKTSAVVRTQAGYPLVVERPKGTER